MNRSQHIKTHPLTARELIDMGIMTDAEAHGAYLTPERQAELQRNIRKANNPLPSQFRNESSHNSLLAISWESANGQYKYFFTAVTRDVCYFSKIDRVNQAACYHHEHVKTWE